MIKIDSRPTSQPKFSKEELLAQLNLKNFDKDEKIEKPEVSKSGTRQKVKREFKFIEEKERKVKGKRLWRAHSWAIVQFLWLYKMIKNYRENKKDNEDKPLHEVFNTIGQAIQVWLFEILKIPLITTDRINFDIINNPNESVSESDKREFSFRRLSVRVMGIVKILTEQTVYMPEVIVRFFKKTFREGGYVPSDFWCKFEKTRIEVDEKHTLLNFSDERCMFCLSFFILAKILVNYILLKPNQQREVNITKKEQRATKLIASVLYYVYRELILDDFPDIVIKEVGIFKKLKLDGDEFITNELFEKKELKYIYEFQFDWILELRDKLKKWMLMLCSLIKTNKYNRYRGREPGILVND